MCPSSLCFGRSVGRSPRGALVSDGLILVRRRSLGDVVLVGAVAAALDGPVTLLTDPQFVTVATLLRGVRRAMAWERGAPIEPLLGRLPRHPVVDLEGRAEVARLARSLGVPYRRWPKGSGRRLLWLARLGPGRGSVVGRYGAACRVGPIEPPWIDPPARPDARAVALIPGASWAAKRWPADRFAALGRDLGRPIVVLGSAEERPLVDAVAREIPGASAIAERGFEATIAALRDCCIAVGGDTGLMHLAGALGVRTVTVLGPTAAADGFVERPGAMVGLPLACRPCALHGRQRCPLGHHRCMRGVTVEAVRRAALAQLRHPPRDDNLPSMR